MHIKLDILIKASKTQQHGFFWKGNLPGLIEVCFNSNQTQRNQWQWDSIGVVASTHSWAAVLTVTEMYMKQITVDNRGIKMNTHKQWIILYIMLWKSSHVHQSMTGTDQFYHKNVLPHSYIYTQAPPGPQSAATHPITITFCAQCSSGPGYRWFILPFIKETGVPLKRDQSATRLEKSASNWPFIKKPSQVDHSAEI